MLTLYNKTSRIIVFDKLVTCMIYLGLYCIFHCLPKFCLLIEEQNDVLVPPPPFKLVADNEGYGPINPFLKNSNTLPEVLITMFLRGSQSHSFQTFYSLSAVKISMFKT